MTTVYGVTFIGAREQIERQLKDRGDLQAEECWDCAAYLAKAVRSLHIGHFLDVHTITRSFDPLVTFSAARRAYKRG